MSAKQKIINKVASNKKVSKKLLKKYNLEINEISKVHIFTDAPDSFRHMIDTQFKSINVFNSKPITLEELGL
jgi:hypothetical protein